MYPSICRKLLGFKDFHKNKLLHQLKQHGDRTTKQTVWLQETDEIQAKEFEC